MLHALGYWRPTLGAFPDRTAINPTMPKMRELAEDRQGAIRQADGRIAAPVAGLHARLRAHYDDEAIAAVDKFRADKKLNYQGNPAGLVDERFVDALRVGLSTKRRNSPNEAIVRPFTRCRRLIAASAVNHAQQAGHARGAPGRCHFRRRLPRRRRAAESRGCRTPRARATCGSRRRRTSRRNS